MKPPPFDYVAAQSIEDAVERLAAADGAAKVLAGGQSLMPMLNFRLLAPDLLVDIGRIESLRVIEAAPGGVLIGAGARHREIAENPLLRDRFPILREAMAHVAHMAIRNRGTVGGSLAHADPAAEWPMLAVLLDAVLTVVGPKGAREIAAADFFEAPLTTALEEDELLTAIFLPELPQGAGMGFVETARRAGDFALAGAGALLAVEDGVIAGARLAMLGVHDMPLRAEAAETTLVGKLYDDAARDLAAEAAAAAVSPMDDLHASADFRRHLAGVMAARALDQAWEHMR